MFNRIALEPNFIIMSNNSNLKYLNKVITFHLVLLIAKLERIIRIFNPKQFNIIIYVFSSVLNKVSVSIFLNAKILATGWT